MPNVACVMMQKDEAILLEPWLAYHGHLFGLENLHVIDNGSTLPAVRATLERFAARGVHVDYAHPTRDDYLNKGDIVGATIRELDAAGTYDFFFPTDCDEFVIRQTATGFTADRAAIHAYLETLLREPQTLRMRYQLDNHPLLPDCYVHAGSSKTFFAAGSFGWTDHGHHCDGSRLAEGSRFTDLLHVHFHHMPFERLLQAARQRWIGTVDIDDRKKLVGYEGASAHLARYLLMSPDEYYAQFSQKMLVHFPQLGSLLRQLGSPLDIPRGEADPGMSDQGEANWTMLYAPVYLQDQAYLAANQDVANAGMNALQHYFQFGFREGRRLAPPDQPLPAPPPPQPPTRPRKPPASKSPVPKSPGLKSPGLKSKTPAKKRGAAR
jgi:hypothetical protein